MVEESLKDIIEKPITGEWGKEGGNTKILRTTNFTNEGKLKFKEVVCRDVDVNKVKKKKLINGDIIIEKSGGSPTQPVGRVVYFDEDSEYLCNNFTSILRPKSSFVFAKYLMYILFACHKNGITSKYQNKTIGIINLQLERYINELKIPLPPIEQQKKIAAILDAADELRQKDKALIEKYDELTQSLFLDMFGNPVTNPMGWEKIKLGELGVWRSGGTPSRKNRSYFEGNIPWLSSGELEQMYVSGSKEDISENAIKETSAKIVDVGSLMLGMYDTAALKSSISKIPLSCNQAIAYSNLDCNIVNTVYCYNVIQIGKGHYKRLQRGVRQKNMNLSMIKSIKIIQPPLDLQNQFAERVKAIEAQKAIAQESLRKSEDLFSSLLQRAFKGELV